MAEADHKQTYIVTEDLALAHSLSDDSDLLPPGVLEQCRDMLYRNLREITGAELKVYTEERVVSELNTLVRSVCAELDNPFIVSLTLYTNGHHASLKATRVAYPDGDGFTKHEKVIARSCTPALPMQVREILDEADGRPIVLVDDGIWSGKTSSQIVELFAEQGVEVSAIVAFLAADWNNFEDKYPVLSTKTSVVRSFASGEVLDWICERDFYIGVPGFGRTLGLGTKLQADPRAIGIPYILPGSPSGDASIPQEYAVSFTLLCLDIAALFYRGRGEILGRDVQVRDLRTIPYEMRNEDMFASVLDAIALWREKYE